MKQLSFLLIEDNEADARQMMALLAELPLLYQLDWSPTAADVFNRLKAVPYDLIFLDIRLPALTGTALLEHMPRRPPVIVVTAYLEYAVPCYDLDVIDFLVKPFDQYRLQRAINRALAGSTLPPGNSAGLSIFLPTNRRMQQFHFKNIRYVEAQGAYAKIHEQQGGVTVNSSISWLETQLPASQFIRIQKSFIVNVACITAVEARSVWIGSTELTVGEPYRPLLKQFLLMKRENKGFNGESEAVPAG